MGESNFGAGAGSFGAGFAKGLAGALYDNKQQQREKERRAEERRDRLMMSVLPHVLENAEDDTDIEPFLQQAFPDKFGKAGKPVKSKDGRSTPWDHVRNVLTLGRKGAKTDSAMMDSPADGGITGTMPRPTGGQYGEASAPGPVSTTTQALAPLLTAQQNTGVASPPGDMPLPPATVTIPGAPGIPTTVTPTARTPTGQPTPKRAGPTFMGVRLRSRDDREEAATGIPAKTRLAHKLYESGAVKTLDEAFDRVGLNDTRSGVSGFQSVPGTMDGKPAFGVFDRAAGVYKDPVTGEILKNFVPRETGASSTSMGTMANQAAVALGFKNATEAVNAGKGAELTTKIQELTGVLAEARGAGTGRARIATELAMPIGTTAAAAFNVPPTTTLGQLSLVNGLTPAQQEKIASLGQIDALLDEIDTTLPKVFPDVAPGIWGNLKTQYQLGMQTLAANEDLAKLDAAINASLAQVAQLSGQPGSRLSDTDLRLAESTLAQLTPTIFGGDTLATARARVGVLRALLVKAQGASPTRTTPGASGVTLAPPAGAAPPGMRWNGKAWEFIN